MVVATRALNGQSHHSPGDNVDEVIDDVVPVVEESSSEGQVAQGGQWTLILAQLHPVSGDLLPDEAVKGQVIVERIDDVVTIGIGEGVFPFGCEDVAPGV